MALKSDAIWDKLQERLTTVDPNKRSLVAVFQVNLKSGGEVAKSIVLDLKEVKLTVGTCDNADAVLTLDDDDFVQIAAKQTTFGKLVEEGRASATGDLELVKQLDEKFQNK